MTSPPANDLFAETRWSVVVAAADSAKGSQHQRALAQLCQTYWFPIYAYLRRQGHQKAAAEDLTQAFFAQLLAKKRHALADPERKERSLPATGLLPFRGSGCAGVHLSGGSRRGWARRFRRPMGARFFRTQSSGISERGSR